MEEKQLLQKFHSLRTDATGLILASESLSELNEIKIDFLGKSGRLTLLMKELTKIPADRRPEIRRAEALQRDGVVAVQLDEPVRIARALGRRGLLLRSGTS